LKEVSAGEGFTGLGWIAPDSKKEDSLSAIPDKNSIYSNAFEIERFCRPYFSLYPRTIDDAPRSAEKAARFWKCKLSVLEV
jgi:hypothetical protein